MKKYRLDMIINNKLAKVKVFNSRNKADRYLSEYLYSNGLQVEDVILRNRNHDQEFVCDYGNRFFINRVIA